MDDQQKLKAMFPRGSADFFQANETHTRTQLSNSHPKHYKAEPLGETIPGKEKGLGRITVRYRLRRVRPLDPDNATGSTKDLTDGLCRCGLLPGDDPTKIVLVVEQEKVKHFDREGTEIEIDYP